MSDMRYYKECLGEITTQDICKCIQPVSSNDGLDANIQTALMLVR